MEDSPRSHPLKSLIRIALIATYPLLGISMLALMGLSFGGAFVTEFTVENKTDKLVVVTPVGTVGKQGDRYPLPVYMWPFPPIWSSQRGGFDIPAGESIEIIYDMDDINFSEIVVHDQDGERGQLIVNPNPTSNQYRAPAQKHFVIDDLDALAAVRGRVRNASRVAQIPTNAPRIILGVLFGPCGLCSFCYRGSIERSTNPIQCKSQLPAGHEDRITTTVHPSGRFRVFQVECRSRPPGDRDRSSGRLAPQDRVVPCVHLASA